MWIINLSQPKGRRKTVNEDTYCDVGGRGDAGEAILYACGYVEASWPQIVK